MAQLDDPNPGFKWPVAVSHEIAAPQTKVWEVISSPGNLEKCHPFCAKNPVKTWPGAAARDEIHYLNGLVFERRFCHWIEGKGYDLNIGKPTGQTSFVSWRINAIDEEKSLLRIAVYPYLLQNFPKIIRLFPHHLYVSPRLTSYLSSVVRGFEWHLLNDEPVPRNQFGTHPWFS